MSKSLIHQHVPVVSLLPTSLSESFMEGSPTPSTSKDPPISTYKDPPPNLAQSTPEKASHHAKKSKLSGKNLISN